MQSPLTEQHFSELHERHWTLVDSFFSPDFVESLSARALVLWNEGQFNEAKIGRGADQTKAQKIRSDMICWVDLDQTENPIPELKKNLNCLQFELSRTLLLSLDSVECHFAKYSPGQHYDEHIDQPKAQSFLHGERVISFMLYLNKAWTPGHGGELQIQGEHLVEPRWGRLVLFRSDTVPHAVLAAHFDRWSLTGWFRRT